jgi:hypothetical protein
MTAVAKAAAALAGVRNKKLLPIPDGWFTVAQYAEHVGCCKSSARTAMQKLFADGSLEVQKHPVLDMSGRVNYTTIYRTK